MCDPVNERYWMGPRPPLHGPDDPGGLDLYVGGVEHAVLHLMYSRFWHKVLYDLGPPGQRRALTPACPASVRGVSGRGARSLFVIFEMCTSKNGVSAREIQRKYDLTAKSAWFMLHRIREAMKGDPTGGFAVRRHTGRRDLDRWGAQEPAPERPSRAEPHTRIPNLQHNGKSTTTRTLLAN